ncbi:MAG: PHB depolymerase family esterase [Congregibacter sp.]
MATNGKLKALALLLILSASAITLPTSAELLNATLSIDDTQRPYLIHVPNHPDASAHPIIILLHGHGGSASQLMGLGERAAPFRPWLQIAERHHAVLIAPNGNIGSDGKQGWNDLRGVRTNPRTDDLSFIRALVDLTVRQHRGDPGRVYVVGISNGGHMALRIALEDPDLVAGIGAIAAAMPANSSTAVSDKPLSVVFMNGTRDRLMPYAGGDMAKGRGTVLSTDDSFRYWANANHCSDKVDTYRYNDRTGKDKSRVIRSLLANCKAGVRVALFEVRGAGHSTPSLTEKYRSLYLLLTGRQNWDIESAEEIWSVFTTALPETPMPRDASDASRAAMHEIGIRAVN